MQEVADMAVDSNVNCLPGDMEGRKVLLRDIARLRVGNVRHSTDVSNAHALRRNTEGMSRVARCHGPCRATARNVHVLPDMEIAMATMEDITVVHNPVPITTMVADTMTVAARRQEASKTPSSRPMGPGYPRSHAE